MDAVGVTPSSNLYTSIDGIRIAHAESDSDDDRFTNPDTIRHRQKTTNITEGKPKLIGGGYMLSGNHNVTNDSPPHSKNGSITASPAAAVAVSNNAGSPSSGSFPSYAYDPESAIPGLPTIPMNSRKREEVLKKNILIENEHAEREISETCLESLDKRFSAFVNVETSVADSEDFPLGW
jgi:hypothetical protein